jgi:hypothetical protein
MTSSNIKERIGVASNWEDRVVARGKIRSGGNARLNSGKDINILGTNLSAGENLALNAGNDVNIRAERLDSYFHAENRQHNGKSEFTKETTRHDLASVHAGKNMTIQSGADTNIIGGNLSSGQDMTLASKGQLHIASVQDYESQSYQSSSKGLFSHSEDVNIKQSVRQKASNLTSGGNFYSMSLGDTNIIASNVSAGGEGTFLAGSYRDEKGNIFTNKDAQLNVVSLADSEYAYNYHKSGSLDLGAAVIGTVAGGYHGYKIGTQAERGRVKLNETYDTNERASHLNFGGNLSAVSSGNMNIISSKLNSAGNMELLAGRTLDDQGTLQKINENAQITIGAQQEIHQSRSLEKEYAPDYAGIAMTSAISQASAMIEFVGKYDPSLKIAQWTANQTSKSLGEITGNKEIEKYGFLVEDTRDGPVLKKISR